MQFALVAAEEALAASKPKANPERIGIVLGTALAGNFYHCRSARTNYEKRKIEG